MIKISIHEPMPMSAVAYYRSIGTFSYLPKIQPNIQINLPSQISWSNLVGTDILYMERPQQDADLNALEIAKEFNVKIWVDYDDLLHEVPKYNPSYKFYTTTHVGKNIEKAIELADIVTVSTPKIKEYYEKFNPNIHIIENAHNDYQYQWEKVETTVDAINWRGSATHRQDLLSVACEMFSLAEKYSDWAWTFIGNEVWYITDRIKNSFNLAECDIISYNKFIKDLKSGIQIVPLLWNEFNKAKSNIGWIEGTYAGSVTVAPNLGEFTKPGVCMYDDKADSFAYYLEKCIKSKSFRQEKYIESFEYIAQNLMLSKVNKKRITIIEKLLDEK